MTHRRMADICRESTWIVQRKRRMGGLTVTSEVSESCRAEAGGEGGSAAATAL